MSDPGAATTPIPFECEVCGLIYVVQVDAKTYHPENDEYEPCPECGHVTVVPK